LAMNCFCAGRRQYDIQKFTVLLVHVVDFTPPSAFRQSTPFFIQLVQEFLSKPTTINMEKVTTE
jgi:hypothetical protein